jgi:hypothetical protein
MSANRTASGIGRWAGTIGGRAARVWRALPHDRRIAAAAALALFVTLFLPWYQETVIVPGTKGAAAASTSVTGWGAFSFVEAAVLLVAAGVLTLLFQRGEGRAFHLPGGDGWVIMAAGAWACVLVVWRIFDKQTTSIRGPGASISGIEWGIFVALAGAAFLAYAGSRIRAAHQPEPPLPGHDWGFGAAADQGGVVARAAEAPGRAPAPVRAPSAPQSRRAPAEQARPVSGDEQAVPRRPASLRQRPTDDQPYFERPPGWLTGAPKRDAQPEPGAPGAPSERGATGAGPARRASGATPDPDEAPTRHSGSDAAPGPDEAPTRHAARPRREAPVPPATPAARQQSEDQLTIPLEPEE